MRFNMLSSYHGRLHYECAQTFLTVEEHYSKRGSPKIYKYSLNTIISRSLILFITFISFA